MAGDGHSPDRNQWHDIDIKAHNNNHSNNNYSNLIGDNPKAEQQTEAVQVISGLGLKCPRCESSNTKFCYFNNYNRTQPRHFCKSCRRYWTHGGSLRTVPIGGGCRRSSYSAKRSADGASCKSTGKNKRLCCSVTSPNATADTQLAALAADNNLGPIHHLGTLSQPFPAASMSTCTPNPFPPTHSSFIPFTAPGINGNLETSAFFDADSETFPLFHSSSPSEEDRLSALSRSENIPSHSYLQDQLRLAVDANHFLPHFQHDNVHDEPLDALLAKGTSFTSWSTAEGQDLFDAHHHPAYCYGNNSWMMPTEFQAQSIAHSTLI